MHKKYKKIDSLALNESLICSNRNSRHMEFTDKSRKRHVHRENFKEHHNRGSKGKGRRKSSENNAKVYTNEGPRHIDADLAPNNASKKQSLERSKERRRSSVRREKTFIEKPNNTYEANKYSRHHSSEKHSEKRPHESRESHVNNRPNNVVFFSTITRPNENKYEIKDLYTPKSRDEKRRHEHRKKQETSQDKKPSVHESSVKKEKRKFGRGESGSKKSKERQSKSPDNKQPLSALLNVRSNVDLGPYEKYFAVAEKLPSQKEKSKEAKKVKHESRAEKSENRPIKTVAELPAHDNTMRRRKRRTHIFPEVHPTTTKTVENKAEDDFKNYFTRIQTLIDEKLNVLINAKTNESFPRDNQDVEKTNNPRRKHHRKLRKEEGNVEKLYYKDIFNKERDHDNLIKIRNTSPLAEASGSAPRWSKNREHEGVFKDDVYCSLHDSTSNKLEGRKNIKNDRLELREGNLRCTNLMKAKELMDREKEKYNKRNRVRSKTRDMQDSSIILGYETFSKEISHSERKQRSFKEQYVVKVPPKDEENFQDIILCERKLSLKKRKESSQERHSSLTSKIEELPSDTRTNRKYKTHETNNDYKMSQPKGGHASMDIFNKESVSSEQYRTISKQQTIYVNSQVENSKNDFIVQGIEPPSLEYPRNTRDKRLPRNKKPNLECKVVSIIDIPSQVTQSIEAETTPSLNVLNFSKEIMKQPPVEAQVSQCMNVDLPCENTVDKKKKTKRFKQYYKYSRHLSSNSGNTSDVKTIISDSHRKISDPSDYEENEIEQPENDIATKLSIDVATMTDINEKKSVIDVTQKQLLASKEVKCSYLNTLSSSNSEYSLRFDKKPASSKMRDFLKRIAVTSKLQESSTSRELKNRIFLKFTSNSEIMLLENSENRVYKSRSGVFDVTPQGKSDFESVYCNGKSDKHNFQSTSGEEDFMKMCMKNAKKPEKPKYNLRQILLENNYENIGESSMKIMHNLFTDSEIRISGVQNFSNNQDENGILCTKISNVHNIMDPTIDFDTVKEIPRKRQKSFTTQVFPISPDMCDATTKTSIGKQVSVQTQQQSPIVEQNQKIYAQSQKAFNIVQREIETNTDDYSKWHDTENAAQPLKSVDRKFNIRNKKVFTKPEIVNAQKCAGCQDTCTFHNKEKPQTPRSFSRRPYTPKPKSSTRPEKSGDRNTDNYQEAISCSSRRPQIQKAVVKETNDRSVLDEKHAENDQDSLTYDTERVPDLRCRVKTTDNQKSFNRPRSRGVKMTEHRHEEISTETGGVPVEVISDENQKVFNAKENFDDRIVNNGQDAPLYDSERLQTQKCSTRKASNQTQKLPNKQDTVRKSSIRTSEKRNQEPGINSREYPRRHSCQRDNKVSPTRTTPVPKRQSSSSPPQRSNEKKEQILSKTLPARTNTKGVEENSDRKGMSLDANEGDKGIPQAGTDNIGNRQEISLVKQNELEHDPKIVKRSNVVVSKTSVNPSSNKECHSKLPTKKRDNLAASNTINKLDPGVTQKLKSPTKIQKKYVEICVESNTSLTVQRDPPIDLKVAPINLLRSKSLVEVGSKKRFLPATPHKSEMSFHEMVVSSKEETRISTLIQLDRFGSKSKAQSLCKSNAFSLDQYEDSVISGRPYSSRLFFTKNFRGNEMSSYRRRKMYDEKIRRKMKEKTNCQKDNNDPQIFEVRFLTMLNDEDELSSFEPGIEMRRTEVNENNKKNGSLSSVDAPESNLVQYLNENVNIKNIFLKNSDTDQQKIFNFCKNLEEVTKILNCFKDFDVDNNVFTLLEHFCKSVVSYCDLTSTSSNKTKETKSIMDNNNKLEIIAETENPPDEDNNEVTIKYCSPAFATPLMEESSEQEFDHEYLFKSSNALHFGNGVSCPELASNNSTFDFLYENNSYDSLSKHLGKNFPIDLHRKSTRNSNNQFVNQYVVHNVPRARTGSPRSEESGYASVGSRKQKSRSVTDFLKKSPISEAISSKWDFEKYYMLGIEEQRQKMRKFKSGFDYGVLDANFQEESSSIFQIDVKDPVTQVLNGKENEIMLNCEPNMKNETNLEPLVKVDGGATGPIEQKLTFNTDKENSSVVEFTNSSVVEDMNPSVISCNANLSNDCLDIENVNRKASVISCKIILSNECLKTESATFVYPHCFDEDVSFKESTVINDDTLTVPHQDTSNMEYLLRLNDPEKIKQLMGKKFFSNLLSVYKKEMEISRKLADDDEFFQCDLLKLLAEQKGGTHSAWSLKQTKSKFVNLFKRKKSAKSKECLELAKPQCLDQETDEYQGRLQSLAYNARRYFTMLVQAVKINQNINDEIKLCGLLKLLERIEKGDFTILRREEEVNFEEEIKDQMRQAFLSIYKISLAEAKKCKRALTSSDLKLIRVFVSKYRIGLLSKTDIIASYIGRGVIQTENQLKAAVTYLMRSQTSNLSLCDFEQFCGFK